MGNRVFGDFNTDPAKGLPLRHALTFYAAYPDIIGANGQNARLDYQRLLHRAALSSNHELAIKPIERSALEGYRTLFAERLVQRLRAGELVARGFAPGGTALVELPPEWWSRVRVDPDESSATANGVTVTGILIYSPAEFPAQGSPAYLPDASTSTGSPSDRPARSLQDGCDAWLSERVGRVGRDGTKVKLTTLIQEGAALGYSSRTVKAAFRKLPQQVRSRVGRPHKIRAVN